MALLSIMDQTTINELKDIVVVKAIYSNGREIFRFNHYQPQLKIQLDIKIKLLLEENSK